MGRKRKPTHLHLIEGTAQKCRLNPNEPEASDELPRAPETLSKRACELFGVLRARLEGIGIASVTDTENLCLLAQTLEEIELCNDDIRANGMKYSRLDLIRVEENGKQVVKAQRTWKTNPSVMQRAVAMRRAQSLLTEFGLSPASRGKVSAPGKKPKAGNRWNRIANS